jgi:hypothetical protein
VEGSEEVEGRGDPMNSMLMGDLRDADLVIDVESQLSDKARTWLLQLEQMEAKEAAEELAADFVLSTNAISR